MMLRARFTRRRWGLLLALSALCLGPSAAEAQTGGGPGVIFAGQELEEYLRFLQTAGVVPIHQWTIRPFTPIETAQLVPGPLHPWNGRLEVEAQRPVSIIPPSLALRYNSAFPYGPNDGPTWAGRGLTATVQAGIALRSGPLSVVLAPVVSWAQNQAFALTPNGLPGPLAYGDAFFARTIDRPQRFGANAYRVIDPGESTIALHVGPAALGVSSASQWWGPATEFPFVLGNNAGGIPRVFLSSARPLDLWLGHFQGEVQWGELLQSDYSPVTGPNRFQSLDDPGRRRFMTGAVFSFSPRGADGLELGMGRFFHRPWPQNGFTKRMLLAPFEALFKKNLPNEQPLPGINNQQGVADNQLLSVFMRWVFPQSGVEIYTEFGRDDHSYDQRDFANEPDHGGFSRLFGLRKTWGTAWGLRAEAINFEATTIAQVRGEGVVYTHTVLRQGHTMRGQLLGADIGPGSSAGTYVAVDHYMASGRMSWYYRRATEYEWPAYQFTGVQPPRAMDVMHTLGAEVVRFVPGMDLFVGAASVWELNRGLRNDATNLSLQLGVRPHLR